MTVFDAVNVYPKCCSLHMTLDFFNNSLRIPKNIPIGNDFIPVRYCKLCLYVTELKDQDTTFVLGATGKSVGERSEPTSLGGPVYSSFVISPSESEIDFGKSNHNRLSRLIYARVAE